MQFGLHGQADIIGDQANCSTQLLQLGMIHGDETKRLQTDGSAGTGAEKFSHGEDGSKGQGKHQFHDCS